MNCIKLFKVATYCENITTIVTAIKKPYGSGKIKSYSKVLIKREFEEKFVLVVKEFEASKICEIMKIIHKFGYSY